MSSSVAALTNVNVQKCQFCSEEIRAEARKCKHCGEFVKSAVSKRILAIFAAGVVIACVLAGMQPSSQGVLLVGVWAIFALSFARMFRRA